MKINSKILIIAGSDSSGGAGIQADIKSVTSLGSYAMTAITAVTAQNTEGIKSIIPIPIREISNQIEFTYGLSGYAVRNLKEKLLAQENRTSKRKNDC